jgi:hypothetical protein
MNETFETLGFASQNEMDAVASLVAVCSEFTGLADSLGGKTPRLSTQQESTIDGPFILIPKSLMPELAKGPMGRLGRSILSAPARKLSAPKPLSSPTAEATSLDEDSWDFDLPSTHSSAPKPTPSPRRPLDEGVGEDSFEAIISKLEDTGFGNPATAELIRLNKAKRRHRR